MVQKHIMRMRNLLYARVLILIFFVGSAFAVCSIPQKASAAENRLHIAVAANFTKPMKELIRAYAQKSDTIITATYGATGLLYGQIASGAPIDMFFAADMKRPETLHAQHIALSPVQYARGEVVLYSASHDLGTYPNWQQALHTISTGSISIANPKTAPYGSAALTALQQTDMIGMVSPRLVYGKSVGQAFQFVETNSADVGFVAKSQALAGTGSYLPVPHAPLIDQGACIISGSNEPEAKAFLAFVLSKAGTAIRTKFGYK